MAEHEDFLYEDNPESPGDSRDADSALGCSLTTSSAETLPSVLVTLWEENGRKYCSNYYLPADDEELGRQRQFHLLDQMLPQLYTKMGRLIVSSVDQYALCYETFGTVNHSPLGPSVHRVLDVGCGAGFWAIEFAVLHPESEIYNVDLMPNQQPFAPPNVISQVDDLEEQWNFSSSFDYIHVMMMNGAFKDWPKFYWQAFGYLNSGGYVEVKDMDFPLRCEDGSLPRNSALQQWSDLMVQASERSGFFLNTSEKAADLMRKAGFVEVVRIPYKWPIGNWTKRKDLKLLGSMVRDNLFRGVEAMSLALFTRFLGWTPDDVKIFARQVEVDLLNPSYHAYFNVFVTYGCKR